MAGLKELSTLSSKEIRLNRNESEVICVFKCGLILTQIETINYMEKIRKLTCVRQKNTLLRCLHGDIYTNERLHRFGLNDNPNCTFCNHLDTLDHRLNECPRTISLLNEIIRKTRTLRLTENEQDYDSITKLMAAHKDADQITVSIHSEALQILLTGKEIDPVAATNRIIETIYKRERKPPLRAILRTLLN